MNFGPFDTFLQGIYVDMDSLFDTRFAVLEQIDPVLAMINLKNDWSNRSVDVFEGIEKSTFDELYKTRDNSVLALAPSTQVIDAVRNWVIKALGVINGSPNGDKVVVFVNVYPYLITRKEARNIGSAMSLALGETVEVRMLNANPEHITTKVAKNYFSAMFMYDWDSWLEGNTLNGSFEALRIPDVTLYAPKLFKVGMPTEEDMQRTGHPNISMFDQLEMVAGPQIGLEFIEPAFFSTFMPKDLLDHYDAMKAAVTGLK